MSVCFQCAGIVQKTNTCPLSVQPYRIVDVHALNVNGIHGGCFHSASSQQTITKHIFPPNAKENEAKARVVNKTNSQNKKF